MLDSPRNDPPRDAGGRFVEQTNAFLSWALAAERGLPRIPRRRVDQGGFDEILTHPGARALAEHWWMLVLSDHRIER